MDNRSPDSVEKYFDKEADNYDQRSGGFWWSVLRKKEYKACMELLAPQSGEIILDAGCGAGYYTRAIANTGAKVWAVDLSEKMVAQVKDARVEKALCGDLATIQLEARFDKILSAGALEFCPKPEAVIENLTKHLKPGGRLVLLAPMKSLLSNIYKKYHAGHGLTINTFTANELTEICGKFGMSFIEQRRPTFSSAFRFDKQL